MSNTARTCPKCSGSMDEGFVLDASRGGALVSRWLKGLPEDSAWHEGVRAKGHECRLITTHRCNMCGFLESYACLETTPPDFFHP